MSHKLIVMFCALALVLGLSFSAKAEVQNVRVGGDIEVLGIWQAAYNVYDKLEINDTEVAGTNNDPVVQDFLVSRVRVYVDASLTDNVEAYIRLAEDRDWGLNTFDPADDVEVDLAYLTLNDMYGYPFTLCIGRQELLYGEGFLVGDGIIGTVDTINQTYQYDNRKSFDAIKAVWVYEPHQIDVFTAKITEGYFQNIDMDLYGINWNIDGGMYGIWDIGLFVLEQNPIVVGTNETLALTLRGEGTVPQITTGTLALKGEIVRQWGKVASGTTDPSGLYPARADQEKRSAWGGYLEGEYTFDNPYAPYLGIGYIYMSGDKEPEDRTKTVEAFNPMFEDERYGEIAEVVYGAGSGIFWPGMTGTTAMTNARIWKLCGGFNPTESVNIDLTYYNFTADQKVISAPLLLGQTTDPDDQNKDIGDEFDLTITYDYTEDVTFGLLYALFNPGKFFSMGDDEVIGVDYSFSLDRATELLGSVKITF